MILYFYSFHTYHKNRHDYQSHTNTMVAATHFLNTTTTNILTRSESDYLSAPMHRLNSPSRHMNYPITSDCWSSPSVQMLLLVLMGFNTF